MIIKEVNIYQTKKNIILSAKCKIRKIGTDTVRFTFNKKYKSYIYPDASPFAAALLLPSMKQGEDLIINGSISKQLFEGMQEIMQIVSQWDIGLKKIKIKADNIIEDLAEPMITSTFFSGGVDSFYTFLKHKEDSKNPISHLLLVKGYDIDIHNEKLWSATHRNIQKIAKIENVQLIEVESNIRQLLEAILPWDYTHGGCLAAVGLCLRRKIKLSYIPSSYTLKQQFPWGTHVDLDNRWSTEILKFVHDGTESSRVKKVALQIAKSSTALNNLRVCYKQLKGTYNCGVCDKCLRTMINLYLAGVLDKSKTFPKFLDLKRISNINIEGEHGTIYHKENLVALQKNKLFPEMQKALQISINNTTEKNISLYRQILNLPIYIDHIYMYGSFRKFLLLALRRNSK